MSFANLKKSRNDFMQKLNAEINKVNNFGTETKNYTDDESGKQKWINLVMDVRRSFSSSM